MLGKLKSAFRTANTVPDNGDGPSVHRAKISKRVSAKLARNPLITRIESDQVEIYARRDFLSAKECRGLRTIIDAEAQPSRLFSGTQGPDYRSSYSAHMGSAPLVRDIENRITSLMGTDRASGEPIQGQRYTRGQEYKPHCDYFPVDHSLWKEMEPEGGQRCWTAMIYLSDVEAGGETWFPHASFSIPPVEGTILMWNNLLSTGAVNPDTLHAAKPVQSGVKYIVTKWFRERQWVRNAKRH